MFGLEFKNYPDTSTPLNADLNEMQRNLLDLVYPIGRGFIDFTDTDYSDYLGFEWERECVGMFPIGKDENDGDFDEIGKTGGEKKHTLTIDEMPNHNHNGGELDNAIGTREWGTGVDRYMIGTGAGYPIGIMISKGGGQPHNNLPPYKVVNYWKRVA